MAGNSERRGATRKTKKGPTTGTGGHGRKALRGKGPTPKAEDRVYHAAHKRKAAEERRDSPRPARGSRSAGASRAVDFEVVVGRNAALEALRAGIPADRIYLAARLDADDRTREIIDLASNRSIDLVEVGRPQLDQIAGGETHQGIVVAVPPYEYADIDDLLDRAAAAGNAPLIVALDGVTDPRNLGAVLRSAAAFGVHGVLVPERRAAGVTASVWKVSAGAVSRVPVARATNLVRALESLKKAGCFVVGLDAEGASGVGEIAFATDPLVLVVGSEGNGLSRLVRETCDAVASIPIDSATESLNAAVAAGITLYEVARARATAS